MFEFFTSVIFQQNMSFFLQEVVFKYQKLIKKRFQ